MQAQGWRSIDERSPRRRPPQVVPARAPAAPVDPTLRWMETTVIWLGSLLSHAVIGFFLVMCYLEARREPEQAFSVTIWRDAKGKDVLKIGAPEEGPPVKGEEKAPEPPKKEEPPKVEPPKAPPAPEPAPVAAPPPPPAPEPAAQAPEPVAPLPVPGPEGGVKDPQPAAPALGAGATAGAPKSDTPGVGKPSGPEVTDAEIERDPTAAIRRRRSGTLVALREGSQRDIVVVTGAYDHIQEVLDRLEIPYTLLDPEDLPRADLSKCKALLINCHSNYAAGLFRLGETGPMEKEIDALEEKEIALRKRVQESKDKKKVFEYGLELLKVTSQLSSMRQQLAAVTGATVLVENVRKFVMSGGYVFTSDWGLSILERAFPGTVKNGGNIGPRSVVLRPRFNAKSPLLEEVFSGGAKSGTVVSQKLMWEIDTGSYAIKIEKPAVVETLVEAVDTTRNSAVAVLITPEHATGKALHILSHFQKQTTKQGDYALQNLLLNFLSERTKR